MKKLLFVVLNFMLMASAFGQASHYVWELIDNKGNRNQTYPNVIEINPEIQAMMEQVDTLNLYHSIAWMQQFVRNAYSPEAVITQNWLVEQYEAIGMEPSVFYFFADWPNNDTLDAGNVMAIQRGTLYPDEYVMVSSHYDHPDGPGADDNASGTAGVLEIARILSQYSFDRSIIYINFNVEEDGCIGSLEFAKECARQNKNSLGVFNLDMIGWYPPELDTIEMFTACYHLTRNLYNYYTQVANLYLPETPTKWRTKGETGGGDHNRLYLYEYPAIYIGDTEYIRQNPCYHRPCDSIGSGVNSFALAEAFVKATLAATAELANGKLPPQNLTATCDEAKIYLRWDETNYAQSYKLFRDNELIAETTDNYFEDEDANDGDMHDYYVVAVGQNGMESNESNHDKIKVSQPLTLPFYNDFSQNTDGLMFYDSLWCKASSYLQYAVPIAEDYYSYVETNWFSIPSDAPHATMYFDYKAFKASSSSFQPHQIYHIVVEATTDRVYWHKLAALVGISNLWGHKEISLDDFIGEPYVQVRIMCECIENNSIYFTDAPDGDVSIMYINNITIDFSGLDVPEVHYETFNSLEICPNPASSTIEIKTDLDDEFNVIIYNILGIKVLEKQDFTNGTIDISTLPSGIYFIKATKDGKGIAKRLVKE